MIKRWGIPGDRIGMVYHGIDAPKKNDGVRPISVPESWKGRFLFTAGSIRPARGLEDALWAINYLVSQNAEIEGIVIAGEVPTNMIPYQKKLKNWIKKHNLSSKVFWAGNLNENEMAWCYQNCRAFVMTSRVESFGQVALEAMSYGCVCVATDNPCLPEIFGDAALFYTPKDGKALAEMIQTVLAWDENQCKAASERAIKRAGEFSWDICVEKTVTALEIGNCELYLVAEGEGPKRNEYEALAADFKIIDKCFFVGFRQMDEHIGLLSISDIVVVPSYYDP